MLPELTPEINHNSTPTLVDIPSAAGSAVVPPASLIPSTTPGQYEPGYVQAFDADLAPLRKSQGTVLDAIEYGLKESFAYRLLYEPIVERPDFPDTGDQVQGDALYLMVQNAGVEPNEHELDRLKKATSRAEQDYYVQYMQQRQERQRLSQEYPVVAGATGFADLDLLVPFGLLGKIGVGASKLSRASAVARTAVGSAAFVGGGLALEGGTVSGLDAVDIATLGVIGGVSGLLAKELPKRAGTIDGISLYKEADDVPELSPAKVKEDLSLPEHEARTVNDAVALHNIYNDIAETMTPGRITEQMRQLSTQTTLLPRVANAVGGGAEEAVVAWLSKTTNPQTQ
jgi:hypothetical protein